MTILKVVLEIIKSLPGVCFTISDLTQLNNLYKSNTIESFEEITFMIFILINFTGFIFTNKFYSINTYVAYMAPALIDICIISYSYYKKKQYTKCKLFIISMILITITFFTIVFNTPTIFTKYSSIIGIIPAILNPLSVSLQLYKLYKSKNCNGVSKFTWLLQLVGNICLYFLIGKYTSIINICFTLLTAFIIFLILLLCYLYKK